MRSASRSRSRWTWWFGSPRSRHPTYGSGPGIRARELEELDDGRVVLRLRAGGFYEIKSWVLSFGAAAEVLEPEELRVAVREEMREALGLDDEGAT